ISGLGRRIREKSVSGSGNRPHRAQRTDTFSTRAGKSGDEPKAAKGSLTYIRERKSASALTQVVPQEGEIPPRSVRFQPITSFETIPAHAIIMEFRRARSTEAHPARPQENQ